MVKMSLEYEGSLRCRITHGPSGTVVRTDAPADNQGKGELFSPTDLVCTGVASCMMTTMAIFAGRHDIRLEGSRAEFEKEMASDPRRIAKITIVFHMAAGIDQGMRAALERAAHACPAHKSMDASVQIPVRFEYPD